MSSSEAYREEFSFAVPEAGEVSALLLKPAHAQAMLALAHGAGAGMRHPFMESLSHELANSGVATLRYQFPYMQHGRSTPDRPGVLTATVRAAAGAAAERAEGLAIFAGGKSMGGRITSLAASQEPLKSIRGIIFVGFPLHPPSKLGTERATHLSKVGVPMLFLQGTRDSLAKLELLLPICEHLPNTTLHVVDTADHSFHLLKKSGRSDAQAIQELAQTISSWMRTTAS